MAASIPEKLCILPWIHANLNINGDIKPCCLSDGSVTYGKVSEIGLRESLNSEAAKKIRREFLSDEIPKSCRGCIAEEPITKESTRLSSNQLYQNHFSLLKETAADGSLPVPSVKFLDVRFSNVCNLKCRSCGHPSSSTWLEDHQAVHAGYQSPRKISSFTSPESFIEYVKDGLSEIEEIYFAGGEPTLDASHWKFLDHLIAVGKASEVTLSYNSNLTVTGLSKYNYFNYWPKFKSVQLKVSMDGSEEHFEYMRKGASWKEFKSNILKLALFCPNIHIQYIVTVSLLNIGHLPKACLDWSEQNLLTNDQKAITLNLVHSPEELSIYLLKPEEAKSILQQCLHTLSQTETPLRKSAKDLLQTVIEILEGIIQGQGVNTSYNESLRKKFQNNTLLLDSRRQESTEKLFPELAGLLNSAL